MNGPMVERTTGDFSDVELYAIAASLTGKDSDRICSVVMVVTYHQDDGTHALAVCNDMPGEPVAVAELLAHAAAHCRGNCRSCARKIRRGNHG